MKNLCFLVAFLLISQLSFGGNINKTYSFNNPVILSENGYDIVTFENTLLTGITGEPALPYQDIRLLLPPGEEALTVNIRFEDEVLMNGSFRLYPQQQSRPVSEGGPGTFMLDEEIYGSRETYPEHQMGRYSTHFMNGHSILLSSFTPVKYVPATGTVSYYMKVTVEIVTRSTDRAEKAMQNLGTRVTLPEVLRMVQNPEILERYALKETRDEGYQVLVITPQQFVDDFDGYRMLYLIRGMKTQVTAVEDISVNGQGADLPEKIRNYIIQEYQDNGVEFVLLGGDVEHVPHRGFYCYVQSGWGYEDYNIPADLYYSALDGTWNDNGDNKWGEIGEDDLLPDVAVARWPFSTSAQLERLVHKASLYQDEPVTGELQRPLIAGENLWSDPLTWGCDFLDLLIGHHEDNGYTTDGIPETDDIMWLCDRDNGWNQWDLINAVNQGRNFIHHSGHANESYVMRLGISDITNQNFSQVNGVDHNYTLVYTHGCLCGAFDESDCIGEAMVLIDNFAVAGAFNSRYGWFNEGQTEGPSAHLHREFVDALYDQKENHIGATHLISKVNTSAWVNAPGQWEEGALRWCFYACNILGDPALSVWTKEPVQVNVEYPDNIMQGATSFNVSVSSDGQPAEGLMCVIMSGDEMLGCSPTDASGQAIVPMPGGFSGEEAELVVSGYHCQPHHYPLDVIVGTGSHTAQTGMKVYPSPFEDKVTVTIFRDQPGDANIIFSLADGQVIDQYFLPLKSGMNSWNFHTADWPSGVLILKVTSGNTVMTSKIIHLKK